jgi:hypothetical protein
MTAYGVRMDTTCQVHRHRELVPIERHHIWPLGDGGPDVESNKVTVCANGHYSIHSLIDLMRKAGGRVPWTVRRRYGGGVRRYAQQGYDAIQTRAATTGGTA